MELQLKKYRNFQYRFTFYLKNDITKLSLALGRTEKKKGMVIIWQKKI